MPRQVKQADPGHPIPASGWNRIADFMKRNIVGGDGILIKRAGQQVVISSKAKAGGVGASSSNQALTLNVDIVPTLPAVPASGLRFVYWTSSGTGTGDNQIWFASEHDTIWTPSQKGTELLGTVL